MAASTKEAPKKRRRGAGRPWAPGKSGNPHGRPKEDPEVREIARAHAPEALMRAIHWMRQDENAKASLVAINVILDRALGKPLQAHEVVGKDGGPIAYSVEDRRAMIDELLAETERLTVSSDDDELSGATTGSRATTH